MPERIYVNVNSDFDSTGYMQPRSVEGVRMWVDKAAKDLGETYEILKKLDRPHTYTGRLAHEYVLSIDWLNEKRG